MSKRQRTGITETDEISQTSNDTHEPPVTVEREESNGEVENVAGASTIQPHENNEITRPPRSYNRRLRSRRSHISYRLLYTNNMATHGRQTIWNHCTKNIVEGLIYCNYCPKIWRIDHCLGATSMLLKHIKDNHYYAEE